MQAILKSKYYLLIEFALLCVALPTCVIAYRWAPYMFAFLWGAAGYCFLILKLTKDFDLKRNWNWDAVTWQHLKPILLRFALACIGMTVFIWLYNAERMFGLLRHSPLFLPFLFILYPVLSALPQEFIFCSFIFKRYDRFFKSDRSKIIVSAIVFAYAHVLFINWVAPLLSLIAGVIFAHTYAKHRSLALVTIEHGLYGNFLFFIGLGWYFYGGAVAQMAG